MLLHAITSLHGQAGPRERLLMEIERFPAADRGRARDALALACRLHGPLPGTEAPTSARPVFDRLTGRYAPNRTAPTHLNGRRRGAIIIPQ